ncbi:type VI secretion system-associated protein TagF [Variovorax sp. J22R24]|uniref:type VI secretion system-associated protein TagF n=1 Tax=Variovorax gracilis TaxID=3053502 RepID=UPI002576DA69|nr:type VI secretion system-associated protein TagF [Variovorax sp. J22R24]MDM0108088.1 type VI secretion system-associated protein TagF [Variovorax sp. J22R24]
MVRLPSRRVSWYGKLPTRGDFVGRGLPARWRSEWDGWLQRGLTLAATTLDGAALRERLGAFAPWRYLALAAPGETWCGILVASHDRVGRAFPLTLAERITAPAPPDEIAAWLASLLDAAAEGPEALEAAIAALPPRSGQDFSPAEAWPASPASLWWPLGAAHDVVPKVAAWPPEPALLPELLGIQPAAHQIPSAE